MAYFSLHAYDADVWLPEFKGLNQIDETLNTDIRYAIVAENVETPHGVLQPHAGYKLLDGEFENRVETLAKFHRRWYAGNGSKDWMVCASGGKLYARQVGDSIGWMQIPMPSGQTSFQSNVWSWVTYQISSENVENPVDVLLMSNAVDGMIMVVPPDRPTTFGDLVGQDLTFNDIKTMTFEELYSPRWQIQTISTRGKKFGVIERYAERIWGGAIDGDPDMLMYSAVYNPTDWRLYTPDPDPEDPDQTEGQPEDGGGDIQQPSWDGDSFTALKAFGNQLLAFKGTRVWRVMGVSPGEYTFTEQYGGGALYPATVVVDVERVIMASEDGLSTYDGMSVAPYARDQIKELWKRVNRAALDQMCAAMVERRYYLSFPIDGSEVNNAMLVFNQEDGTILFYNDMTVEAFLSAAGALYATSSSLPGRILIVRYDSWTEGESSGSATRWVSPWMDFGYKRIQKGGFDLYMTPEVQDEAVTLRISIETEKKRKTKNYTIQRTAKEHRNKRLHFGGAGRRFRIVIETEAGNKAPWRLIGGLQLVVETDPD